MAEKNDEKTKTLYEALGVRSDATATDIARAYARIRSESQRDDVWINPRLEEKQKLAYETLTDRVKREAYDRSLAAPGPAPKAKAPPAQARPAAQPRASPDSEPPPDAQPPPRAPRPARRRWRVGLILVAGLALVAAAGAAWYLLDYRPASRASQRAPEKSYTGAELAEMVSPYLGRLQGALIGGTRDMGLALAMAENEMVTPCRDVPAGMILALRVGAATPKAELARANEDLGICLISVRGATSGLKVRAGTPAPGEPLYAIVREAGGPPRPLKVSVGRALADPKGQALEIKAQAPLPNGAPILDAQARLVGLVAEPHAYGEGIVAALGAARIAASRPSAIPNVAPGAAPATSPPAEAAAPAPGSPRGTKVGQGFTTLWKEAEDEDRRLVEVLDDTKKGYIGLPLAYWTKWKGRNPDVPQVTHCVVTYGAEEDVVADYEQATIMHSPEGYWFCALTRYQVPLEELPKGVYTFRIFVNGDEVSQASIPMERRFFTPAVKIILVLVLGFALLVWVGGRKTKD